MVAVHDAAKFACVPSKLYRSLCKSDDQLPTLHVVGSCKKLPMNSAHMLRVQVEHAEQQEMTHHVEQGRQLTHEPQRASGRPTIPLNVCHGKRVTAALQTGLRPPPPLLQHEPRRQERQIKAPIGFDRKQVTFGERMCGTPNSALALQANYSPAARLCRVGDG
jgi:hypothetical protein